MNDRLTWEDLPPAVRDGIENYYGTIVKAETIDGLRPGFAARVYAEGDDAFIKAFRLDHPYAELYLREVEAARLLPMRAPAPRLLWKREIGAWLVLGWELINDHARHVDLRPGSPDLPFILDALGWLATEIVDGCFRTAMEHFDDLLAKARVMLDLPPGKLPGRDLYEAALSAFSTDRLSGNTLVHGDLARRNMLTKDNAIFMIDWSQAFIGEWWIDLATFAPHFIADGHTAEQTDQLMFGATPLWAEAPYAGVAGVSAVMALYHLHQAEYGPEKHRQEEQRIADASRNWLAYQLPRV